MDEQFTEERKAAIRRAKDILKPEEHIILEARYLGKRTKTIRELAAELGVPHSRVERMELRVRAAIRRITRQIVELPSTFPLAKEGGELSL